MSRLLKLPLEGLSESWLSAQATRVRVLGDFVDGLNANSSDGTCGFPAAQLYEASYVPTVCIPTRARSANRYEAVSLLRQIAALAVNGFSRWH